MQLIIFSVKNSKCIVKRTILCIEQHINKMGLVVIEGLFDVVYSLLISQVSIHETGKQRKESRFQNARKSVYFLERKAEY